MTAINLPGQLELTTVVDHEDKPWKIKMFNPESTGIQLAKLLIDYENRPTSETWSRIQALAKEILK